MFLHENFSDIITDPDQFDDGTPTTFAFTGNRPDLEQSAYVQDLIRLGNWTVSAGLRWDHYQLLVNQNALSPRISVARYFPSAGLVLHASYDRIFQTPDSGNILLSSSAQVVSLNPEVLRLPVEPSHGNYFEIGGTKSIFDHLRFDANYYRRYVNNFADDDQILSTAVSFPIAFDKAVIYGAEAKLEIPKWGRWSGYASYSYMVGNGWLPATGGLFLGDDANNALNDLTGHFPDSQDQRNTVRVRMRYQALSRLWLAGSTEYGSGLPFEFEGDYNQALAQYGPEVVSRVNFNRGRVRPSLAVGASAGADLYKNDRVSTTFQGDMQNINNRLNVIDFGGLFSGNAISPPRSWALRLQAQF
jgi:outer membrane receptor for Fe3+-dicitrate